MDPIVIALIALVLIAILGLAWFSLKGDARSIGSEPSEGYHTLKSDYQSGMGGGEQKEWKVPRDPQEYAKQFVPKGRKND